MPVVGAVAGVVGAGAQLFGAAKGASAQQGIADAQRTQALQDRAQAMSFAMPTAQELQQIGDRIQMQQRYQAVQDASIERDTKILNSLDPSLVTAGEQANALMKGQEASIMAPMKQQQDFQRKQLQQQLAAQLGPGYETSSAGQQALQSFDMNSGLALQKAQMETLQGVTNYMGYGMSSRTSMMGEERQGFRTGSDMSMETLSGMNRLQGRQMEAVLGTSKEAIGTAGNQFAGDAALAKGLSGVGSSLSTLGGTMMGSALAGSTKNAPDPSQRASGYGIMSPGP